MIPQKLFFRFITRGLFVLLLLFISCRKNEAFKTPDSYSNFTEVFDAFWNKMNINYVYWDVDTTDWDAVYRRYRPAFAKLDLQNSGDCKKSLQYFREMTAGLVDGHYYLDFIHPAIKDSFLYTALDQKRSQPAFHNPYSYTTVVKNYLDPGYISGYDSTTLPRQLLFALSGTIQNRIVYFNCNEFSLFKSFVSTTVNGVKPVLQFFFNVLQSSGIKGIIIDVRGNTGGELADLNFLVGHFIDRPLQFGYTRYKNGSGRLDYTPWVPAITDPQPGAGNINKPIIVLADNFSASLAELVTMAIRSLPTGIFVGETTWGATGPMTKNEIYNDGQFDIKDFLSVKMSSAMFKYLDGKIYEGKGVPPDVFVPFNFSELNNGIDRQLEKAISLIP